MASRTLNMVEAINHRLTILTGFFDVNGAANPVAQGTTVGMGVVSVTYAATGILTVLLQDAWFGLVGFYTQMFADPTQTIGAIPKLTTTDVVVAKTLVIQTVTISTGAAVAPPAASAGKGIFFTAFLRNSSVR